MYCKTSVKTRHQNIFFLALIYLSANTFFIENENPKYQRQAKSLITILTLNMFANLPLENIHIAKQAVKGPEI